MDVALEGLHVSGPGTYDILNALMSSNGNLRLVIDEQARVVAGASGASVVGAAEGATPVW